MVHVPYLIEDLGIILATAAIVTLVCKKLKQPVVLGYLIAGFFVGPHFPFFLTVKDTQNVSTWAEIGVIFMLFGLGLEFSFKKLNKVGKSATITATFEILFMLGIGYITGQILGWSRMDSLFLGGILSISSTTIIVRAFEELGLKGNKFVSLVFGVLIVEDLIAILLLVLLSSVAVTQTLSGAELLSSSLRLVFFLVLWFLLGIYVLPVFLRKFRDYLSNETILIISIALCLMMVMFASYVGFSPALGAFIMGSILAETREGHRIEHLILPVKDLFSAVFFVSVGMLINMQVLVDYFWTILLITVLTILGKFISTTVGAIVSGRNLKNSVQAGLSLAQIGEFSFIIATLGTTLKVTSDFLYPIAVAVSAITTFTTPYLIKYSEPFCNWVEKKLPPNVKDSLSRYEHAMTSTSDRTLLSLVWREYGIKIFLNSIVIIGMTFTMRRLLLPKAYEYFGEMPEFELLGCILVFLASGPFLWAVFVGGPSHSMRYHVYTAIQLRKLQIGITVTKFLIGCLLAGFIVSQFTSIWAFTGIGLIFAAAIGTFFFSQISEPIYRKIEKRFLSNLSENERAELEERTQTPDLAPWNAVLVELTISPHSQLITKTLADARVKEDFGVTIAMIDRGGHRILAPKRDDVLLPYDKIFLIGTDEQIAEIKKVIEIKQQTDLPPVSESYGLLSMFLTSDSAFVKKDIRTCGLREAVDGLIVGIERGGERILSPDSSITLEEGDLIWIVGDMGKIKAVAYK